MSADETLTPELARMLLDRQWGHPSVMDTVDAIVGQWERDRAELAQRRRECVRCGQVNLPEVHSCYDRTALTADYYQRWQDATAELARVRAQRDAIVPLAREGVRTAERLSTSEYHAASVALDAIRAEQDTTTTTEA